jgi:putative phosphoribosyl transferase
MNAEIGQLHTDSARAVRIPTGSISLDADLVVPVGAAGLVLFAHPNENSRSSPSHQFAAERLHRSGLGTLLFDLLTPVESMSDSGPAPWCFNIGLLTQRLVCAAHWVGDEDEARQLPIGFFGTGTGAAASLVAAADLGRSIAAVVSYQGRPDLAGNALRRVKSPTLLIAGEPDEAGLALNREACDMLACPKELSVLPTSAPNLEAPGAMEPTIRLAANWFKQHFKLLPRARFPR